MPTRTIRFDEVLKRTGLSRNTIYRRIAEGTFPRQIQLGSNAVGWLESDIDAWIAERLVGHQRWPTPSEANLSPQSP